MQEHTAYEIYGILSTLSNIGYYLKKKKILNGLKVLAYGF